MLRRPVIGIATQSLDAIPGKLTPCWVMGQRYVRALAASGATPWLIPLMPDEELTLRDIYSHLDGLFLTGGVDIDPAHYGEERHECCDRGDRARDWTELALIRWALADRLPILGVCRGIQALNVACGGSLYQDVAEQCPRAIKHDYFSTPGTGFTRDFLAHTVHIQPGSRLREFLGTEETAVNSMHHQGIKCLAPGLTATAFAPDGLIEGVEKPELPFVVGVQWHPEELVETQAPMRRLFVGFVAAAAQAPAGRANPR